MVTDINLQHQIEQFYYHEAAVLDDRRYSDWVDLFTDDAHYWMPIRRTRTVDELDKEFSEPGQMAYYDDDKAMLEARVRKLETGYSWSEDPPSRTRHNINNVRVISEGPREITRIVNAETKEEAKESVIELQVESNFMLYRTRLNSEEDLWVGMRKDTLRRVDGSFQISDRKVLIDQTVILSRNLSNFF